MYVGIHMHMLTSDVHVTIYCADLCMQYFSQLAFYFICFSHPLRMKPAIYVLVVCSIAIIFITSSAMANQANQNWQRLRKN